MRLSEQWLREWSNPKLTTEELNVLLDGCEDTLNIITRSPELVDYKYKVRLRVTDFKGYVFNRQIKRRGV